MSSFLRGNKQRPWVWPIRIIALTGLLISVYLIIFYHSEIPLPRQLKPKPTPSAKPIPRPQYPAHAFDSQIQELRTVADWRKPDDLKVVALVFFGRKRFITVLQCYLERNMVENGGVIDEIVFMVKTEVEEDLAYLPELLASNPKYRALYQHQTGSDYSQMWNMCEKGIMYVKIDDDVLFIEDSTIRSMVKRKYEHPEYLVVSANTVVQYFFAWVHHHMGAIHPYLPALDALPDTPKKSWRASELPTWEGPNDYNLTAFEAPAHHRWLPLPPGSNTDRTPIAEAQYGGGAGHEDWMVGAQQHYSFLENLEKKELWRYAFDLWDAQYQRVSINLIAIMGDDVLEMSPMPRDDELFMTVDYPKKTGRHVVIDGHGVAVHNGYWAMARWMGQDGKVDKHGIDDTDVLDRYRAYAEEFICPH
ncbi:hypothetical protein MMC25_002981 [Agyrium rufum]|nr:hypothetical protein [Agyrium rufum]